MKMPSSGCALRLHTMAACEECAALVCPAHPAYPYSVALKCAGSATLEQGQEHSIDRLVGTQYALVFPARINALSATEVRFLERRRPPCTWE